MKQLIILLLAIPLAWSTANLSYVVNGSNQNLRVAHLDKGSPKTISSLNAYSKANTNYDVLDTDVVYIGNQTGLGDRIALLSESNQLSGRYGLLINSDANNTLLGSRSYECYFYKGNPQFTLTYNVYSNGSKSYYDYKFNYLPDLNNDIVYVNSVTSSSSTSQASIACNKMDTDIKRYLGQTKKHKGKTK